MKNHLHGDVLRRQAVETASTIPVCTGFGLHLDIMPKQKFMPGVHIVGCLEYEADMIKRLRGRVRFVPGAMAEASPVTRSVPQSAPPGQEAMP